MAIASTYNFLWEFCPEVVMMRGAAEERVVVEKKKKN